MIVTKNFLSISFDSTSGFRSYNLKMIDRSIFNNIKSHSYSFFVETSFILNKKFNVKALPIEMPIRFSEKSKMNFVDAVTTILLIVKLFFKRFFN